MGVCGNLYAGLDMTCIEPVRRNRQEVVLVNRSDVRTKAISTSYLNIDGDFVCRHRVMFDLKQGATGYLYRIGQNASAIFGSAEKTEKNGIVQYSHTVTVAVVGVDEQSKCILSQLDLADYFAAIKYSDNTVEVYGFEYGLKTAGYTYDPTNTDGALLKLVSDNDALEDELPLIYYSQDGTESEDFDNLFANHEITYVGDFNDDFNDDFNNQST